MPVTVNDGDSAVVTDRVGEGVRLAVGVGEEVIDGVSV